MEMLSHQFFSLLIDHYYTITSYFTKFLQDDYTIMSIGLACLLTAGFTMFVPRLARGIDKLLLRLCKFIFVIAVGIVIASIFTVSFGFALGDVLKHPEVLGVVEMWSKQTPEGQNGISFLLTLSLMVLVLGGYLIFISWGTQRLIEGMSFSLMGLMWFYDDSTVLPEAHRELILGAVLVVIVIAVLINKGLVDAREEREKKINQRHPKQSDGDVQKKAPARFFRRKSMRQRKP